MELTPDNDAALYMLGQAQQRKGDIAGAVRNWRRAIAANPEYAEAYYNLSRALAESDPAESKKLQQRFEALQEKNRITDRSQTLGNFALASAAAHDWPEAIAQLREGIQVCGHCAALPLLRKDLGLIYCHSGDWENGLAELIEAQKLKPGDPEIAQAIKIARSLQK